MVLAALEASPGPRPDTTFQVMHDTVMTIIDAVANEWPHTRFRNLHDALRYARQYLPAKLHKQLSMMNKAYSFMKHMLAHDVASLGAAFVSTLPSSASRPDDRDFPDTTTCKTGCGRGCTGEYDSKSGTFVGSHGAGSDRSMSASSVDFDAAPLPDTAPTIKCRRSSRRNAVPATRIGSSTPSSKGYDDHVCVHAHGKDHDDRDDDDDPPTGSGTDPYVEDTSMAADSGGVSDAPGLREGHNKVDESSGGTSSDPVCSNASLKLLLAEFIADQAEARQDLEQKMAAMAASSAACSAAISRRAEAPG